MAARDSSVIVNPDLLAEDYIPEKIPGREQQLKAIGRCLMPALSRNKPLHAWLSGASGSGKTATSKYVLKQMQLEANVRGIYVNCWECHTLHLVMERIVTDLRLLHTAQSSTTYKLMKFQRHIQAEPFIIVLDEVDKPEPKEKNTILYSLSTLGKVGLICISNDKLAFYSLEDRVKSRLNPVQLDFFPYTPEDLVEILNDRANLSLVPGCWNGQLLENIANLSGGDARVAIQTLKDAAYDAGANRDKIIGESHIRNGWKNALNWKRTYLLEKLTPDHRLLYGLVKNNPGIVSGNLWQTYMLQARERGTEPIAIRTFSKYMSQFRDLGLIRVEPAKVKEGNVRKFYVVE